MHRITDVRAFAPSEEGALSGNEALCTCGFRARTSLGEREALNSGHAHANYMNKKEGHK